MRSEATPLPELDHALTDLPPAHIHHSNLVSVVGRNAIQLLHCSGRSLRGHSNNNNTNWSNIITYEVGTN